MAIFKKRYDFSELTETDHLNEESDEVKDVNIPIVTSIPPGGISEEQNLYEKELENYKNMLKSGYSDIGLGWQNDGYKQKDDYNSIYKSVRRYSKDDLYPKNKIEGISYDKPSQDIILQFDKDKDEIIEKTRARKSKNITEYNQFADEYYTQSTGYKPFKVNNDELQKYKDAFEKLKMDNSKINKSLYHYTNLSKKLEKENKILRQKLELLERDPDEYKKRNSIDPFNEENWEE